MFAVKSNSSSSTLRLLQSKIPQIATPGVLFRGTATTLQVATYKIPTKQRKTITVYEPLPTAHKGRKLLQELRESLYDRYDPTGWRRQLISKDNEEHLRAGDVIRINYKDSLKNNSFIGYILAIDRNGAASTILLRNKVTKVGVELRVPLFNPLIERIDIVKRPAKYRRRNRHYYIRDNRLDVEDLEASLKKRY